MEDNFLIIMIFFQKNGFFVAILNQKLPHPIDNIKEKPTTASCLHQIYKAAPCVTGATGVAGTEIGRAHV